VYELRLTDEFPSVWYERFIECETEKFLGLINPRINPLDFNLVCVFFGISLNCANEKFV
jgi:hypothetical protein